MPWLKAKLEHNSRILGESLTAEQVRELYIYEPYFRFNSFGGLVNSTHLHNLIRIAHAYPNTVFALWTKQNGTVERVRKSGIAKPKNLRLIFSSPVLNKPVKLERLSPWFSGTFTVWTEDYPGLNCKGQCLDCLTCWDDEGFEVHEALRRPGDKA